jgi:hypothetical protein
VNALGGLTSPVCWHDSISLVSIFNIYFLIILQIYRPFWNLSKININRRGPRRKRPIALCHGGCTSWATTVRSPPTVRCRVWASRHLTPSATAVGGAATTATAVGFSAVADGSSRAYIKGDGDYRSRHATAGPPSLCPPL